MNGGQSRWGVGWQTVKGLPNVKTYPNAVTYHQPTKYQNILQFNPCNWHFFKICGPAYSIVKVKNKPETKLFHAQLYWGKISTTHKNSKTETWRLSCFETHVLFIRHCFTSARSLTERIYGSCMVFVINKLHKSIRTDVVFVKGGLRRWGVGWQTVHGLPNFYTYPSAVTYHQPTKYQTILQFNQRNWHFFKICGPVYCKSQEQARCKTFSCSTLLSIKFQQLIKAQKLKNDDFLNCIEPYVLYYQALLAFYHLWTR